MSRIGSSPYFPEVLRQEALRRRLPPWPLRALEPLASLPYAQEIALKEAALAAFLSAAHLPLQPLQILPSPLPRGYRATSKRRVIPREGRIVLAANRDDPTRAGFTPSALEPEEHARLFRALAAALNQPAMGRTAARLSWVILRTTAKGAAVIFNATRSDERIVNGLSLLADEVAGKDPHLRGAYLFVDPTRSDYYLESGTAGGGLALQRLAGPETLTASFEGRDYLYHPAVFSQVNPSIVPAMLSQVRRLAGQGARLWDLYCGYGLFALALCDGFAAVVGVEASAEAVACARANGERRPGIWGSRRAGADLRFDQLRITGPALAGLFAEVPAASEALVIDPPYAGAPAPVLLAAGARGVRRVVHVFCNTSRIPADAAIWRKAGYRINEIVPLDMFPGTPELETLVLLEPGQPAAAGAGARHAAGGGPPAATACAASLAAADSHAPAAALTFSRRRAFSFLLCDL